MPAERPLLENERLVLRVCTLNPKTGRFRIPENLNSATGIRSSIHLLGLLDGIERKGSVKFEVDPFIKKNIKQKIAESCPKRDGIHQIPSSFRSSLKVSGVIFERVLKELAEEKFPFVRKEPTQKEQSEFAKRFRMLVKGQETGLLQDVSEKKYRMERSVSEREDKISRIRDYLWNEAEPSGEVLMDRAVVSKWKPGDDVPDSVKKLLKKYEDKL